MSKSVSKRGGTKGRRLARVAWTAAALLWAAEITSASLAFWAGPTPLNSARIEGGVASVKWVTGDPDPLRTSDEWQPAGVGWRTHRLWFWPSDGLFWEFKHGGVIVHAVVIPLWMPALALTILPAWLRYTRCFSVSGTCRCGYDLSGNTSGVCPECGRSHRRTAIPTL